MHSLYDNAHKKNIMRIFFSILTFIFAMWMLISFSWLIAFFWISSLIISLASAKDEASKIEVNEKTETKKEIEKIFHERRN